MNLEMNLVSALAHILELIIAFQFFSELFNGNGQKNCRAAVGFVFMPQRVRHICFLIKHC